MLTAPTALRAEPQPTLMDAGVREAIDAVMHLIGQPVDVLAAALTTELAAQGRILTADFVYRVARVFAGADIAVQAPQQRIPATVSHLVS